MRLAAAFIACLVDVSVALTQVAPAVELTPANVRALADTVLGEYVRQSAAPSLAVVVVQGDSVLFAKGYGFEQGERPVHVDSTAFYIASVSKLFVTTAVMQLVDAGRLRLDDRVRDILPAVDIPYEVTVRHLLTHTSGMDEPFMTGVAPLGSRIPTLEDYFAAHPPRFGRPPGREIRYSNHGIALAARVVERVSGESFEEYAERRLFAPLGMTSSTFQQPPDPAIASRVAHAGAGPVVDHLLVYPAGAMTSTASDMGRFMRLHLGGKLRSRALLSAAALDTMHARQWSGHPDAPGVALGFFETAIGGHRGLFHTGARTHFSLLYLLPSERIGIFIVHSMRQGGVWQPLRTRFVDRFLARFYPTEPTTGQVLSSATATDETQAYAGTYRPVLFSTTTVEKAAGLVTDTRVTAGPDRSLTVRLPGGAVLRATRKSPGVYRAEGTDAFGVTIAFTQDVGVQRMWLSGGTQDPVSFDRIAWYRRGTLHAAMIGASYLAIVLCATILLGHRLVTRWRGRAPEHVMSPVAVAARRALTAGGVLLLLGPILAFALIQTVPEDGPAAAVLRRALGVGLSLVLLGSAGAIASLSLGWVAWRQGLLPRRRLALHVASGLCALLLVALMVHYHLAPWWL